MNEHHHRRRRAAASAGRPDVADWRPEDDQFWEQTGKRVAYRNLWISRAGPAVRLRRLGHGGIITVQMLNLGFRSPRPSSSR